MRWSPASTSATPAGAAPSWHAAAHSQQRLPAREVIPHRVTLSNYMIPLKEITEHKKLDDLAAPGGRVDHVDMYYNAGHPGVEEPHYHVVLWHVSKADEASVAR